MYILHLYFKFKNFEIYTKFVFVRYPEREYNKNIFSRLFVLLSFSWKARSFFGFGWRCAYSTILPKGQLEAGFRLYKVNDNLDFFNIKESLNVDSETAGDMNGIGYSLRFGLNKKLTIFADRFHRDYNFGRGVLNVKTDILGFRAPISRFNGGRNQFAYQLNYRRNNGSGISKRFSSITFQNSVFNFNPPAEIEFGGVGDRELGIQLIASVRLGLNYYFLPLLNLVKLILFQSYLLVYQLGAADVLNVSSYRCPKSSGYGFHYKIDSKNMLQLVSLSFTKTRQGCLRPCSS